mmetsp:Transcript_13040/g.21452  ORF Transcript_13040/g.21452 Transcript_13040/m.21452 type:complete len:236 (-) Transcript_13040:246-953(-)
MHRPILPDGEHEKYQSQTAGEIFLPFQVHAGGDLAGVIVLHNLDWNLGHPRISSGAGPRAVAKGVLARRSGRLVPWARAARVRWKDRIQRLVPKRAVMGPPHLRCRQAGWCWSISFHKHAAFARLMKALHPALFIRLHAGRHAPQAAGLGGAGRGLEEGCATTPAGRPGGQQGRAAAGAQPGAAARKPGPAGGRGDLPAGGGARFAQLQSWWWACWETCCCRRWQQSLRSRSPFC